MKIKTFLSLGAVSAVTVGTVAALVASTDATGKAQRGTIISEYENVMNMSGVSAGDDISTNSFIQPFADLGSFHSFSLPTYNSREYWGSFVAPMLIPDVEEIVRFSKAFDVFNLKEYVLDKNGNPKKDVNGSNIYKDINFRSLPKENVHIKQYPGGLWQEFELDEDNLVLQVNLRFTHSKVSAVNYKIKNKSNSKRAFKFDWTGEFNEKFASDTGIHKDDVAYISTHPYKTNVHGQPLAIQNPGDTPKVVYYTTDDSDPNAPKLVEYTDDAEITRANFASVFKDKSGVEVHVYAPNTAFKSSSPFVKALVDFKKKYKFINQYNDDDDLNKNDPRNIMKNTVSFTVPQTWHKTPEGSNWLGHEFDKKIQMVFPTSFDMKINVKDTGYTAEMNAPLFIDGNNDNNFYVSTAYSFTAQDRTGFTYQNNTDGTIGRVIDGIGGLMAAEAEDKKVATKAFQATKDRWDYYLDNLVGGDDKTGTFKHRKVAVKAMETLVNNWIGNFGLLQKDGIVPSRSIYYFSTSYWTWDSWKQAVASVNFDPKLAMDNVKALFDNQVVEDSTKDVLVYLGESNRRKSDIGMLPDLTSPYKDNTNWRDSKPPLSGWAVWNVYETIKKNMWNKKNIRTGKMLKDEALDFLKYMYGRLMAYHAWWYLNRDGDGNGINEYGATVSSQKWWGTNHSEDNIAESTAWESGMDNAPRFDINGSGPNDKGLKWTLNRNADNSVSGFVLQQESVDLNSYMYAEKEFLIKIANVLKENGVPYEEIEGMKTGSYLHETLIKPMNEQLKTRVKKSVRDLGIMQNVGKSYDEDIAQFIADGKYLRNYINNKMFDSKSGFFYDLKYEVDDSGNRIIDKDHILVNRGKGPEGFIPLWANASSDANAKKVRKAIMDPHGFNTYVPFPTVAYDNEKFEPDQYWRGPVWLDQAYFGVRALDNYDYNANASYMVNKLFNNAEGLLEGGPIMENYNPLTGEQLNAKGFSWSSGMYLLMYKNYIKGGN